MKQEKLNSILELHRKWIYNEEGGKRANLYGADLYGADLYGANLSCADLSRADLSRANLYGADLYGADLSRANLRGADLSRADLSRADLYGANLYGADLSRANLRGAKNAELAQAKTVICPEGAIIGWKKAELDNDGCPLTGIAKLLIPGDAKRSNASGRKCRASKAVVLALEEVDGTPFQGRAMSQRCRSCIYEVGKTVYPEEPYEDDRWEECASGIHFFITREEAVAY